MPTAAMPVVIDEPQIRWNPRLSKAFDVTQEQFPAASAEEALVSKYLDVEIKHLERRKTSIMSVRMGAYLTAMDRVLAADGWRIDDIRNLNYRGEETTPLYETIELNSTRRADFLVDGMRFLRRTNEDGVEERATFRVQPRWYGLDVTVYGLRSTGTAHALLHRVAAQAKDINFLKGEAFSLSGEFLPKTNESFADLFLEPANAAAVQRVVSLINTRGKAIENRGVLLMGPPGTGKTLSARIVRNEAQATFIWVSARDFHYAGSFGGFTEAFDLARECAPAVICFEDVDNWLYDTTVDLLKTEMDGVSQSTGVVTMMTTNHPELLPAALIDRPGRFHDVLRFGLPDAAARKQMLETWLPGLPAPDLAKAVEATAGYSGAHVRELTRFASIIAEQDGLSLRAALAAALTKLAEQRELITETQRTGSRYRMPSALVTKCAVRVDRPPDYAEKGDSLERMHRAFANLEIKEISTSGRRRFSGIATSPTADRAGDIIEPLGVEFKNPMPLLLFHNSTQPVGEVRFGRPTKDGIPFEAEIPEVTEEGIVKALTDQAWHLVKYKLVKAVSIGFRAFADQMERLVNAGWRFLRTECYELSLVSVGANPEALIHSVKALDASRLAATGTDGALVRSSLPGVTGSRVVKAQKQVASMGPFAEQIKSFEATRAAKVARMDEIMTTAGAAGETLDSQRSEEYDTLKGEVDSIDKHLARLNDHQKMNATTLRPVDGSSPSGAAAARVPSSDPGHHVIHVKHNLAPGIEFARLVICKVASFLSQGSVSPLDVAKARYPDNPRIQQHFVKAAVPAATTDNALWAGSLIDPTNLASEFLEYLRPETIIGKFGTGSIPSLRRLPFNVRINGQVNGGTGYWVGQGKPKPMTAFGFNALTLLWAKIAAIAVITEETARFSTPSAETLVRDGLRDVIVERMDVDLIDPSNAGQVGVQPASITFGVTPLTSAGPTADNVRTDIGRLLGAFLAVNMRVSGLVIIMPSTLALTLSLMRNALGQKEFPEMTANGGSIEGVPVIASEYAANRSGAGHMVIAVNARFIGLADDGQVTVDVSREAALEMSDAPTQNGAAGVGAQLVSLWQNNLLGLKAERFINWSVLKDGAVVYMDDVNWGSVGSPQ